MSINPLGNNHVTPTYLTSEAFQSLPTDIQDSLTQSLSTEELNNIFSPPALPAPTDDGSLNSYYRLMSEVTKNFKDELRAGKKAEQSAYIRTLNVSAAQANSLAEQYEDIQVATVQIQAQAQQEVDDLDEQLNIMAAQVDDQNRFINNLNSGNSTEASKNQTLINQYNDYIKAIKNLGAVDLGNGYYSLSGNQTTLNSYNSAAQTQINNTNAYNSYWSGRLQDINSYNSHTNAYNQAVDYNNTYVNNLIDEYDLTDYIAENNIPSMLAPYSATRSVSYTSIGAPPLLSSLPATFYTNPLPSSLTNNPTPPSFSNIFYTEVDAQLLYDGIYQDLYEDYVAPLETAYQESLQTYVYTSADIRFDPRRAIYKSIGVVPGEVEKRSRKKILPDSWIDNTQPLNETGIVGTSSLSSVVIGLGTPHFALNLSKLLVAQTTHLLNLHYIKEAQQEDLANRLLLFSSNIIENALINSLLPSLGPIASALASLPNESPAISILFAVSFANRIRELTQSNLIQTALETLLNGIPALDNLSPSDKQALIDQLSPALSLNLALIATKFLSANLGLNSLLPELFSSVLPSNLANRVINEASRESQSDFQELVHNLTQSLTTRDFGEDEALFLAETEVLLETQYALNPRSTSVTSDNIETSVLTRSITSSLILNNHYDLSEANTIANDAVQRTLNEGPFPSLNQFKESLELNLRELGVGKTSTEIASHAVVVPNNPFGANATETTENVVHLSTTQLVALLEQRALQLLVPQLGLELSRKITIEIAETLFGTANPDPGDKADVKAPFSLVNVIRNQLYHLRIEHNTQHQEVVTQSFKELIKDSIDLNSFLQKLMDPAHAFIYSLSSGIIYGGHEPSNWKKSIDIVV